MKIRKSTGTRVSVLFSSLLLLTVSAAFALQDGACRTPPMGFNTWNYFACSNINQTTMLGAAAAFCKKHWAPYLNDSVSLKTVGYVYLNMDDCWHGSRDASGNPQASATLFPKGLKWLADTVHSMGLKLGIYSCCGTNTCAGKFASYGYEQKDASAYLKWGIDYLKEDWCNVASTYTNEAGCKTLYGRMRDALKNAIDTAYMTDTSANKVRKPFVFSLCQWGNYNVWNWGDTCGHLWRTTGDITASFTDIMSKASSNNSHAALAKPGAWNDPDMMEVGNGSLTAAQNQSHFDMWCHMAAPLLLGNNLANMTEAVFTIVSNKEVIAVDQDSLGYQGRIVRTVGTTTYWSKKLKSIDTIQNRKWAVLVVNNSGAAVAATIKWSDFHATAGTQYKVRNLWLHKDSTATDSIAIASIPAYGSVHLVLTQIPVTQILDGIHSVADCRTVQFMSRTIAGRAEFFVPSANSSVQVFNTMGKQVSSFQTTSSAWYGLSKTNIMGGTYIVRISASGSTIQGKIVIAR